jgi:hypothetical protein
LLDRPLAIRPDLIDLIHVLLHPAGVGAEMHVVGGPFASLVTLLIEDNRFGNRQAAVYA